MTTGISEHQRQEDDFAQTVNGQPRKHRRSASNMFKERRSLQSQPVDACSLSCHISRQFWGITDFEFFPRPWLREKQWHTVHDMHWPPMIHRHSNAGRKRKSPQPDLTPGHSDRILTYSGPARWWFSIDFMFFFYMFVSSVGSPNCDWALVVAWLGMTRHSARLSQVSCTTMTSWRLELPTTIRLHRHTLYIRCEVSGQVQTLSFINCCMLLPVLESSRNTMLLSIYIYIHIYMLLIYWYLLHIQIGFGIQKGYYVVNHSFSFWSRLISFPIPKWPYLSSTSKHFQAITQLHPFAASCC